LAQGCMPGAASRDVSSKQRLPFLSPE